MPSYTARELERESGFDRRTIAYYVQERLLPKVGRRGRRTRYPQLFLDRLLFIRRVREAEEEGTVPPLSLSDLRDVFERVAPAVIARVADGAIAVTPELVSSPPSAFRLPEMEAPREPIASVRDSGRSFDTARARRDRMEFRLLRRAERAQVEASARMEAPPPDAASEPASPPVLASPAGPASPPALASPAEPESLPAPASPMRYASEVVREESEFGPAHHLAEMLAALESIGRRRQGSSRGPVETWSRIRITPNIELSVRGLTDEDRSLMHAVRRMMRRLIPSAGVLRESDAEPGEGDQE